MQPLKMYRHKIRGQNLVLFMRRNRFLHIGWNGMQINIICVQQLGSFTYTIKYPKIIVPSFIHLIILRNRYAIWCKHLIISCPIFLAIFWEKGSYAIWPKNFKTLLKIHRETTTFLDWCIYIITSYL